MCLTVATCFGACFAINASRSETIEVAAATNPVRSDYLQRVKFDSLDCDLPTDSETVFTLVGKKSTEQGVCYGALSNKEVTVGAGKYRNPALGVKFDEGNYISRLDDSSADRSYGRLQVANYRSGINVPEGCYRFLYPSTSYYLAAFIDGTKGIRKIPNWGTIDYDTYAIDLHVEKVGTSVRVSAAAQSDVPSFADPLYLAFDGQEFFFERLGEEGVDSERYLMMICKIEDANIVLQSRLAFDFDVTQKANNIEEYSNFRNVKIQFRYDLTNSTDAWRYAVEHATQMGIIVGKTTTDVSGSPRSDFTEDDLVVSKAFFSQQTSVDTFTVGIVVPEDHYRSYLYTMAVLRDPSDGLLFSSKYILQSVYILLQSYRSSTDLTSRQQNICRDFYNYIYSNVK